MHSHIISKNERLDTTLINKQNNLRTLNGDWRTQNSFNTPEGAGLSEPSTH